MSNSSPLHWYHKDSRMVANFLIKLYYGKNNSFKSWNKSLVIKPIHTFYGTCFNSYLRSCPFLWQECLNRETNKYILKVLCLLFQKLWIYKCDIFNRIKAKSICFIFYKKFVFIKFKRKYLLEIILYKECVLKYKHNGIILIQLTL